MKIIRQGQLPETRVWHGTCHTCKSEIEAEEKELKVQSDQRDVPIATATCPFCKREMYFLILRENDADQTTTD